MPSVSAARRPRRLVAALALLAVLAPGTIVALLAGPGGGTPQASSGTCAYSDHSIAALQRFSDLVGAEVNCAVVFNDASPDWRTWERPWFLTTTEPDRNWGKWQRADPGKRRLIITQNLFPDEVKNSDWLHAGAVGAYTAHARALAANLVGAGQGDAVIRLGHEANGTWYPDSLGKTDQDFALWRQFWRATVIAMRSVPGAHFRFDWCVNAAVRPIPLDKYYPGDDVVDIVGVDAYDSGLAGVPAGEGRWQTIYTRPGGARDVAAFARAHGKPLSIPEWGIGPRGAADGTSGDDPAYLAGIEGMTRQNRIAYQGYFYSAGYGLALRSGPQSLARYRRAFGGG